MFMFCDDYKGKEQPDKAIAPRKESMRQTPPNVNGKAAQSRGLITG